MSIGLILSLAGGGAGIIFILVVIAKLKRAKKDRSENKDHRKNNKKTAKIERKKIEVRKKYEKTENDIINNPSANHGELSVNTKRKHNHSRNIPCGKDCPAYSNN